MQDRSKNMKKGLRNFLRYRKGEMDGKEKNLFERELQKDPFASEAEEGFSLISADEASSDMRKLEKALANRTSRSRKFTIYRIAASVAVLMIISSVFIVINRDRSARQLSITAGMQEAEIKRDQPIYKPEEEKTEERAVKKEEVLAQNKTVAEEKKEDIITVQAFKAADIEKEEIQAPPVAEMKTERELAAVSEKSARARTLIPSAPVMAGAGKKVEGTVYSAEDRMPVAGASVVIKGTDKGVITDMNGKFSLPVPDSATLVASFIGMNTQEKKIKNDTSLEIELQPSIAALDEVVVVGYGAQRNDEPAAGYEAPAPANGKAQFNRYIEQNIHRPEEATEGQRVVVVVGFRVRTDGSIDSLKIIRSPGKAFSDEALRLIKSGPGWIPAKRDGVVVEDDVRVRIVFK
jgi:outer membrane biosynthesis protein TonB